MIKTSPTYKFWDMIMQMELKVLAFVKAHRENNFSLYVESLESLAPWSFTLDHTNYARWLPIHIRDMKCLPGPVQQILRECWVISKSSNTFSSIPIDQAHEQNNARVKGSGGAVGLTESPVAFRRWMVAGPEIARVLQEFESQLKGETNVDEKKKHHEQGLSTQKTFQSHVKQLVSTISEMGNPFKDDCPELLALDTRNCADASVVDTVHRIQELGLRQYKKFVKDVIDERTVSIHDTISKNTLPLFKRQQPKQISKASLKLTAVTSDRYLFSRLYIASQQRDGDLEEFFKHENQPYPPSLSEFGKLRFGKKSDLISCVNKETPPPPPPASYDVKVFDGAAIVHALPVSSVGTFSEYADSRFLPFLENHLNSTKRFDVVWDEYRVASLKESAREKRGKGVRRKEAGHVKLPQNWQAFLEDSFNKKEMFDFLTKPVETASFPADRVVYITSGENVISSCPRNQMRSCNHEEADTRILVHFHTLSSIWSGLSFWVTFGMGKKFQLLSVNTICEYLGKEKCRALPFFHAFTGCDTMSAFLGKGKKSAWEAWKAYPEATEAFRFVNDSPFIPLEINTPVFDVLQRFVVILYDRTSLATDVNTARRELFTKKNRALENIPPTEDALLNHSNRALYQASIWTSLDEQQFYPSPSDFGWKMENNRWRPRWTVLPEASKACNELLKCGCKKGCKSGRCKCFKANLPCTELCSCSGG
ncbi:uncharacterized protein [Montipora capricornis]|uniref:uncharacterized protein n=1 Tax=Montipora capricornis TaxID=246305 RepID=UPI0035F125DA